MLNLADGEHSLLSMAERSGLSFAELAAAARLLLPITGCSPTQSAALSATDQSTIGQARSFSDMAVGGIGQSMAKAGSSQRTPVAASGA